MQQQSAAQASTRARLDAAQASKLEGVQRRKQSAAPAQLQPLPPPPGGVHPVVFDKFELSPRQLTWVLLCLICC